MTTTYWKSSGSPLAAEEASFARARPTVLFGGLTFCHEELIAAGLAGLGYRCVAIPTPIKADFQAGKEYGNNGQCNPTYFTVGALVNYLKRLRDEEGLSAEEINDQYVFVTAGACGPCRFGMYESEYRLALRNSDFAGFRVIVFQQKGGLEQAEPDAGLRLDTAFFMTLLNAVIIGDLLNAIAYQIRPYEVTPGTTEEVLVRCRREMRKVLERGARGRRTTSPVARLLRPLTPFRTAPALSQFRAQLRSAAYVEGLRTCARLLDEVEVDLTRARPIVKITGEFWAQTTEGDGNFHMFSFLESQGAEVLVEPVTSWVDYLLSQAIQRWRDERGLGAQSVESTLWSRAVAGVKSLRQSFAMRIARRLLHRHYDRLKSAFRTLPPLTNQEELQRVAHPYYHTRSQGGEGHMEVAKNIYSLNHRTSHMVLSLKPFGCMPSTQSDGAQAAVIAHYPELIYLPIETSGEGDAHAHSRVQMALGEAKSRCRSEFESCVERSGYTLDEIRGYVFERRELRRPMLPTGRSRAGVSRAGRFVHSVAERMRAEGVRPRSARSVS